MTLIHKALTNHVSKLRGISCVYGREKDSQLLYLCTGHTLDMKSLWDVLNELYDVRCKWKMIGLGLRTPPSDLDAMSSANSLECLQNILCKWLSGIDPPPTWGTLLTVLRSRLVGEERKAQELEQKYCACVPSPPLSPKPSPKIGMYMHIM